MDLINSVEITILPLAIFPFLSFLHYPSFKGVDIVDFYKPQADPCAQQGNNRKDMNTIH